MDRMQRMGMRAQAQGAPREAGDRRQALAGEGATGASSMRNARSRDVSKQQTSKYYEDVGFRMTEDQYGEYQKNFTKWDEDLAKKQAELGKANNEINKAKSLLNKEKASAEKEIGAAIGRLDTAEDRLRKQNIPTLDQVYKSERQKWSEVRVMGPDGKTVQGVYRVPQGEGLNEFAKSMWKQGYRNQAMHGKNLNITVHNALAKSNRGQELHDSLTQAEKFAKGIFYKEAAPEYQKAQKLAQRQFDQEARNIREGYSQLNKARSQLISNYQSRLGELQGHATDIKVGMGNISNARNDYKKQIASQRSEYEEKRAKRRAMLSGGSE